MAPAELLQTPRRCGHRVVLGTQAKESLNGREPQPGSCVLATWKEEEIVAAGVELRAGEMTRDVDLVQRDGIFFPPENAIEEPPQGGEGVTGPPVHKVLSEKAVPPSCGPSGRHKPLSVLEQVSLVSCCPRGDTWPMSQRGVGTEGDNACLDADPCPQERKQSKGQTTH